MTTKRLLCRKCSPVLARSLEVVRSLHGRHHDDLSVLDAVQREALGFDACGVGLGASKNGLGETIRESAP